jgi:hypothetical protein
VLVGAADVGRNYFENYTVIDFLPCWIAESWKVDRLNFDLAGFDIRDSTIACIAGHGDLLCAPFVMAGSHKGAEIA